MTLAEMEAEVRRHLGIVAGVTDQRLATTTTGPGGTGVRGYLIAARNHLIRRLAIAAPLAVIEYVPMEPTPGTTNRWRGTLGAGREAVYLGVPREVTSGQRLRRAANLNFDNGQYVWRSRSTSAQNWELQVPDGYTPAGGLEVAAVVVDAVMTDPVTNPPAPSHDVLTLLAAAAVAESGDGGGNGSLRRRAEDELERIETLYSQIDEAQGTELREELLGSYGALYGDYLS
jgi:hypothetical protein